MFPPLTPLSSLLLLPPTPKPPPCPPPGVPRRRGRAGCPRRQGPRAPSRRVPGGERSGEVGARGRGAAGPPAAARRRGEREPTSPTFSGENQNRGGDGRVGRRRGGSAALPGSAAAAGAWRRGEAAAAAPGVSLSIAPSSASDSSGRRDSPQRAEKRLLVALSHRGRVSPFWGCPWFRVWCVCARPCVCVCLPVCLRGVPVPGLCIPNIATPPRLPTPLPLPAPPQKSSLGAISGSGADGRAAAHLLPARPAPLRAGVGGRAPPGRKLNTNK